MTALWLTPAELRRVRALRVLERLQDRRANNRAEVLLSAEAASARATASFLASL